MKSIQLGGDVTRRALKTVTGALIALVLGASLLCSGTAAAGGNKVATIIDMMFDPFLISAVNFGVPSKWLENPNKAHKVALDISIIGINGEFTEHGAQLVRLEETAVVAVGFKDSEISVVWTTDTTAQKIGEIFTVCATVVWIKDNLIKKALGPESCRDFGPF